ncbi:MAG TPA: hypothetical protein VHW23_39365 [Kofleriaceae bacterium]|nr:hypothetical protein [Kofleriaceae bacterium]
MRRSGVAIALFVLAACDLDTAPPTAAPGTATAVSAALSYDWQSSFIALTRLGNLYMPNFGDGDSMTDPWWLFDGTAPPFGADGFHETWYISRDALAGTGPFYRLFSPNLSDHMDSVDPSDASGLGYHEEFLHNYPWTTQQPGMLPLTRYLRGDIFDHRTWLNSAPPAGYASDLTWNAASGIPRFGYQRFGNLPDQASVLAAGYASLQNSVMRIDYNRIWGNAIGRITYLPTQTQLVREQIGAMVQSTIFSGSGNAPTGCCTYNPTQSGGTDVANYGNTTRWTGSPVISNTITGTTQVTEVRPLNFTTNAWAGNDAFSPLMWRGTFRKTHQLGYSINGTQFNDVFHMGFEPKLDSLSVLGNDGFNLNNTFWLNMAPFGDGNAGTLALHLLDATTGTLSALPLPPGKFNNETTVCSGCTATTGSVNVNQSPVSKAVIVSNASGSFALGVFSPTQLRQYAAMYWCDGQVPTNGTCPAAFQAIVLNTFNIGEVLSTTYQHNEDVFMVVGTRAVVAQRIHSIYCSLHGTSC